ncbi:MAG: magnesium transporter [Cyanosarcina radialis HA8281-LM2]|jgi:magnesium transporter|nr:magnesium transporter [Cyanosarcina radialis HA8281-LM2]
MNPTERPSALQPLFSRSQANSQQEYVEWLRVQLKRLLAERHLNEAKALLVPAHPADIADAIETLPNTMQAIAFRLLSKDEAIEVYEYLDTEVQQALIEDFRQPELLEIVDRMSPDERARLFDELPAKVVRRLWQQLSPEERDTTVLLLGFKPNTAGRLMTPEYLSLKEERTVQQALEKIRRLADRVETISYLYVTDRDRCLTGILSLRELIVAGPEQTISSIMTRDVVSVSTDTDREEAARLIQEYDFVALPVVDREQRLVGIITVDDVLDILEQETTEDIYAMGGLQASKDSYFQANLFAIARQRVLWLLVLFVTNTLTIGVIRSQEDVLEQVVTLAAFIPLLIDAGGNVGAQSSTVVIRGLNTEESRMKQAVWVIWRETIAGLLLGAMLGLVVFIWATFLQGDVLVAIAVGASLFAISVLAAIAGSALPFLFRSFGLDPALMSAPFITTAVDVLGVWIYLSAARVILQL